MMILVALDIETLDSRGASFESYRSDFKVDSLSLCYPDYTHWYSSDPYSIERKLAELSIGDYGIITHNLQFEYTVLTKLFPQFPLNYVADTMRLAQLYDAGGQDDFTQEPTLTLEQSIALELGETTEEEMGKMWNKSRGLSLEACALRLLPPMYHNHKAVAHDWLKEHAGIKKNFGSNLHLLPPDVLEAYNNKDTEITFALYTELVQRLGAFDWSRDWSLYTLRIKHVGAAYLDGIHIDTESLHSYILEIENEIHTLEQAFLEKFKDEIELVKDIYLLETMEWANDPSLKSDRARATRWNALESGAKDDMWNCFNIGSALDLKALFCNVLKMIPKFLTPKGSPSFKSSHLVQWGEGGMMLLKRKKRLLVLQQACNTYIGAMVDGRVHPQVRAAGTKTGRVAGGSL